jgi:predicted nucleic acid-binding protein
MVIDTCFLIDVMRERKRNKSGPALQKLVDLETTEMYTSVFTVCELRAGAELSGNPKGELERVEKLLQFITVLYPDTAFPVLYGEAEGVLRKNGTPIPVMDLLIGITAKAAGMPLLSKDTKHYGLIPGLVFETY